MPLILTLNCIGTPILISRPLIFGVHWQKIDLSADRLTGIEIDFISCFPYEYLSEIVLISNLLLLKTLRVRPLSISYIIKKEILLIQNYKY